MVVLVLASRVSEAQTAGAIEKRSAAAAPPAPLLQLVRAAASLGYRAGPEPAGFRAQSPCVDPAPDCSRLAVCAGLRTSYRTTLVPDAAFWKGQGTRHQRLHVWLWALTYEDAGAAMRAVDALAWFSFLVDFPASDNVRQHVVSAEGPTVLLLVGHRIDARVLEVTAGRMVAALGTAKPPALPRPRSLDRACVRPAPDARRLSDPTLADGELEVTALAIAACQPGTGAREQLARQLNARGMRFFQAGDLTRAAVAFEVAVRVWHEALKALYNRACVAARAGDAALAAHWLWKLSYVDKSDGPDYGRGSESAAAQLARAHRDRDFDGVRETPEVRAALQCTIGHPRFDKPLDSR